MARFVAGEIGGKPSSVSQAGTASGKVRRWAAEGAGVQGGIQHQVNLLFRTREEDGTNDPHVVTVEDVTKGLGLDETDRTKIHNILTQTRVDFAMSPKTRVPRLPSGMKLLGDFLMKTKRIPSDARMQIRRRANVWWRKYGKTTYEGKPMIRHIVTKSQLESPKLLKAMVGKKGEPPKGGGKGGGPYIGPRGGKWADPQHTIPYKMDKYKMTVEGKDAEKTGKAMEAGIQKAADICQVKPPVCHGNLGIPRSEMPQLPDSVIPKFLKQYQDKGIKVTKQTMKVGQLKATQREINAEKAQGMLNAYKEGSYDPSKKPIIVSKDGYVLDGHHRWASMLLGDPSNTMRTYQVDVDIRTLLKDANGFEGVSQADFSAPSDMREASNKGDDEDHADVAEGQGRNKPKYEGGKKKSDVAEKAIRMEALAAATRDSYLRSRHAQV